MKQNSKLCRSDPEIVSLKNQGYHYNRNAETYMEVGLRLGWAMAELLKE